MSDREPCEECGRMVSEFSKPSEHRATCWHARPTLRQRVEELVAEWEKDHEIFPNEGYGWFAGRLRGLLQETGE